MINNYNKIEEIENLKDLELVRDQTHTKIYKGTYEDKKVYIKLLKNYNPRVKRQDVLKSKEELNKLKIKSFEIITTGKIKDEKYYISEEVIGKDFEMLLDEGKKIEDIKDDISVTMGFFVKMLKNNLFYFGYNLKNVMLSNGEFILIDIEEIEKKIFLKKKAKIKTIWSALRSLEAGAKRTNISYELLEEMFYEEYNKEFGDLLKLKKQIAFYKKIRDRKKELKNKKKNNKFLKIFKGI